jgi:hypothetical protein
VGISPVIVSIIIVLLKAISDKFAEQAINNVTIEMLKE